MKSYILIFSLFVSNSFAVEYDYFKISVSNILDQPTKIKLYDKVSQEFYNVSLYDSNQAYKLEYGIAEPTTTTLVTYGLSFYSLLSQSNYSKELHDPYSLELFYDYKSKYKNDYYYCLGVGYSVLNDRTLDDLKQLNNNLIENNKHFLDSFLARISVIKKFDNFEISLDYRRKLLYSKPITNDLGYFSTTLSISYIY